MTDETQIPQSLVASPDTDHWGADPLEEPMTPTKWHFSKPPRKQQTQTLEWADSIGFESCSIEAPTGSGKSPIAASLANTHTGIVMVPQKILQDQYQALWSDAALLKGSGNYKCKGAENCRVGARHSKVKDCRKCGDCPFAAAKDKFMGARFSLTNYACYFALSQHDPNFDPYHSTLILDESHNLEMSLVDSASLEMTSDMWVKVTKEDFVIPRTLNAAMTQLRQFQAAFANAEVTPSMFWVEVEELCDQITFVQNYSDTEWILSAEKASFKLSPLRVDGLFGKYLGNRGRVIMMSATPPAEELLSGWLGENFNQLVLPSTFPLRNRPVRYVPVEKFNRATLSDPNVQEKLLKRVHAILKHHSHEKGIIHTTTYALAELLRHLDDPRLLIQEPGNREAILQQHLISKKPTVLVSPSMTEGVDLYDDLGRFNILMKVPFANLGNSWVSARKNLGDYWYEWTAMKDMVQAVGRTTRHDQDYSISYILDGQFERLYNNLNGLFPDWFKKSICTTWPPKF